MSPTDGGLSSAPLLPAGTCAACASRLERFARKLGYSYKRCPSCGTVQLDPQPSPAELDRAYRDSYAVAGHYGTDPRACTSASRTYHEAMTSLLIRLGISEGVVDYGSGWGGLLQVMRESGIAARGLELSGQMVADCHQRGLPVQQGGLELLQESSLRALTLVHVFEHLAGHHLWLAEAERKLLPGGYLITMQPTAVLGSAIYPLLRLFSNEPEMPELYKTFHPPWHTVLFSLEGMARLAERTGFTLLEIHPAPQGRNPGLLGVVQRSYELVNRVGWAATGQRWPLCTGHTFVLQKNE